MTGAFRTAGALAFLRENARWLAAGFLLAFGSSVGQTFFILVFSEPIREALSISHGVLGGIYMAATLASAATLIQLGQLVDSRTPVRVLLLVAGGLTLACLGMAATFSVVMLFFVLYILRLFGQGMMSHLSMTLTARWFVASRGKAVAIANLGYPLAAATLPAIGVALIGVMDWRHVWLLAAGFIALALAPVVLALLSKERTPQHSVSADGVDRAAGLDGRHWTRVEVISSRRFWLLAPGVIAPGFSLTIVFFLPDVIAAAKGWSLATVTAHYPFEAVTAVISAFGSGVLVDRFSARALAVFAPIPMAIGFAVLASVDATWGLALAMTCFGLSAGTFGTLHGALWPELFGTANLGAVKALASAVVVLGSALGPGVAGLALDLGVSFPTICVGLAAYGAAACLSFATVSGLVAKPSEPVSGA